MPPRWRAAAAIALLTGACAGPGFLRAAGEPPHPGAIAAANTSDELERHAPVVLQELGLPRLDTPTPLDPDGSGRLADDPAALERLSPGIVPFYASARTQGDRRYLFYALYYRVDWSGSPRSPRTDHVGDLEGALVVVSAASSRIEAVATQAHGRFYLWSPEGGPSAKGASGTFALSASGRPLLFAEAGGHGLYAFGHGRWRPKGGTRYPDGTAGVEHDRLLRIEVGAALGERARAAEIRPLHELHAFTAGERGGFSGLPRGARPPLLWDDKGRRELPAGAIVDDPERLLEVLCR